MTTGRLRVKVGFWTQSIQRSGSTSITPGPDVDSTRTTHSGIKFRPSPVCHALKTIQRKGQLLPVKTYHGLYIMHHSYSVDIA